MYITLKKLCILTEKVRQISMGVMWDRAAMVFFWKLVSDVRNTDRPKVSNIFVALLSRKVIPWTTFLI